MKWEDLHKTYKELNREEREIVDSYKKAKKKEVEYWEGKYPNGVPIVEGFFDCTTIVFKCPNCGEFHKTGEGAENAIPRIYGQNRHLVDFYICCEGEETLMRIQTKTREIRYWEQFDY